MPITQRRRRPLDRRRYYEHLLQKLEYCKEQLQVFTDRDHRHLRDLYFNDGRRRIDFILVYNLNSKPKAMQKVNQYISAVEELGLEFESANSIIFPNLVFIKVHAPREVLLRYAYTMEIDLQFESDIDFPTVHRTFNFQFLFNDLTDPNPNTAIYQRASESVSGERPTDITFSERILIVHQILSSAKYGQDVYEFGLKSILSNKYLHDAFPLHDGPYRWTDEGPLNDRQLLTAYWGHFMMCFKLQPLDLIYKYYGPEVAFYFAFLGFYNKMLIPAAGFGLISFAYGFFTYKTHFNHASSEICVSDKILCPSCQYSFICTFVPVKESCMNSNLTYIFDNVWTFVYSICVCFWATISLEIWKRQQAVLMYKWNLMSLENDPTARPEFHIRTKYRKISKKFHRPEPYVPPMIRFAKKMVSFTVLLISSIVVMAVVIAVIVYKIAMRYYFGKIGVSLINNKHQLVATMTASLISLIAMLIFEQIYVFIARVLTDFENPRTQAEYDKSFIYKQYSLCFLNAYAVLYYISFFKGRYFTYPGDIDQFKHVGVLNSDHCPPQGCILEMCLQLSILILGKSLFKSAMEIGTPWIKGMFNKKKKRRIKASRLAWEKNYVENKVEHYFLFTDYKDIILQYGYIILFTAAFPLAPLLALTYNILEIRIDAFKLLRWYRRPVPIRVEGIGAWNRILHILTRIGVATNAALIAFTTQFVPYILRQYEDETYTGFLNYSLSEFSVNDYSGDLAGYNEGNMSGKTCYYRGKRYPPSHDRKYDLTDDYWQELAIRFLTFLLIEVLVLSSTGVVAYMISDVPRSIRERIKQKTWKEEEIKEEMLNKRISRVF